MLFAPARVRVPAALLLGALLCAMAFALLWTIGQNAIGYAAGGPKTLNVLWHKFYGSYGKEWVVGEVRNQSRQTLYHVMAAAEFYTDDNRQAATGIAPLTPSTLAPGQTARFKVSGPYSDQIEKSWFHFQTADGEQISFSRDKVPSRTTENVHGAPLTNPMVAGAQRTGENQ